jgi:hypothetical protein
MSRRSIGRKSGNRYALSAVSLPDLTQFYMEAAHYLHSRCRVMAEVPATRYVKSDDVHIAYQVLGEGPFDLLFVPGFVSNVEATWRSPDHSAFFRRLASFCRVVLFDKRGTAAAHLQAERAHGVADRAGAADPPRRPFEGGEEAVACCTNLTPAVELQHLADPGVERPQQFAPGTVAKRCGALMAAGPNALRGSGPNPTRAFEDALTLAGSPDPRNDRVCITSLCPRQFL